jgi:hypothetical protein
MIAVAAVALAAAACDEERRVVTPAASVTVKTTGAVPADIAASRRVAEEWMALWEELATLAERTPGDCAAIAAGWGQRIAGNEVAIRTLIATSAAESELMRRRMAARYKARMDRLVPRITAIRTACDGDDAIDAALAVLEPATHGAGRDGHAGGHDHAH